MSDVRKGVTKKTSLILNNVPEIELKGQFKKNNKLF